MSKEEELNKLLEETVWLKELIEDALDDTGMSEFEKQWLRNIIKYYNANIDKLEKLLNNK